MIKNKLENVTLLGVDCVNFDRLALAMEICQKELEFADVKILTSLEVNHKDAVKIDPIKSIEEYSHFIIRELANFITTSHVLIVQYDGFILNPQAWTDDFLNYDYIGSPWLVDGWSVKNLHFPVGLVGKTVVGNGGFSLRSKKLLDLTQRWALEGRLDESSSEDVSICVHNRKSLEDSGIKFAPVDLAYQFSFERQDPSGSVWSGQFGFHGLNWTDISSWTHKHPEYGIANVPYKKTFFKKIASYLYYKLYLLIFHKSFFQK